MQTDSLQAINLKPELTDTANLALSADTATQFSESDEGEDEDVHDYDYAGTYVGSDPKYKMVFEGNTFQYFIGKNMKLNGELAINVYKEGESDHLILLPAGNEVRIDLAVTWDAFYKAEGFDYDEMHFTRQPK